MNRTLRGLPVEQGEGWVVLRRSFDERFWFPLAHTFAPRRADSIEKFGRDDYRKMRRRGEVMAVRCVIEIQHADHDMFRLLEAAERFIELSPCDPDLTGEQWEAWQLYQEIRKEVVGT